MQNIVALMEPSEEAWRTPIKVGNMILNRFCIDEDTAFELAGINYLKTSSDEIKRANHGPSGTTAVHEFKLKRKEKGKGVFIHTFIFISLHEQSISFPKRKA